MEIPKRFYIQSFIAGFGIMATEILSSKILAPVVGTSLIVWSCIIAATLLTLSLGYYLGARIAARAFENSVLVLLFSVAGGFLFTVALLTPHLYSLTSLPPSSALGLTGLTSLLFALLFGIPLTLLAGTSPLLANKLIHNTRDAGTTVGLLSAISTLGGVVGVFGPTLLGSPALGSADTLLITGALVMLSGNLLLPKTKALTSNAAILLLSSLLLYYHQTAPNSPGTVWHGESAFNAIRVYENLKGERFLQFNNESVIQSVYYPNRLYTNHYYDAIPYFVSYQRQASQEEQASMLIIGLAGGTSASQLKNIFGNTIHIDGVEIDPLVTQAAYAYMGLRPEHATIFPEDGRTYVKRSEKQYDVMFIDAYKSDLDIPWTLATIEYWHEVKEKLKFPGIVVSNIATPEKFHDRLNAFANTQSVVFPYVYKIRYPDSTNYLLVAGNKPFNRGSFEQLSIPALQTSTNIKFLRTDFERVTYNPSLPLLTDDRTPVHLFSAQ